MSSFTSYHNQFYPIFKDVRDPVVTPAVLYLTIHPVITKTRCRYFLSSLHRMTSQPTRQAFGVALRRSRFIAVFCQLQAGAMPSVTETVSSPTKEGSPVFSSILPNPAPYKTTATALERYPDLLRGKPETRVFLWRNSREHCRRENTLRPTLQQVITMLDEYISAGRAVRFTALPLVEHANEVTVTFDDTLEEHQKVNSLLYTGYSIAMWDVTWIMRIRRHLFGQYKELVILSVD